MSQHGLAHELRGCRRRSMVVISPATTPGRSSAGSRTRPGRRIFLQHGVEHGVGDLVGHLVGVALGDGLGGEGSWSLGLLVLGGLALLHGRRPGARTWSARSGSAARLSTRLGRPSLFDRSTRRPCSSPSARRSSPRSCRGRIPLPGGRRRSPRSGPRPWPPSLARARSASRSVSAAKPTSTCPGAACATELGQDVAASARGPDLGNPVGLVELRGRHLCGTEVGDRCGHDHHVCAAAEATARLGSISAAVSTPTTVDPGRRRAVAAVVTSVTSAPRRGRRVGEGVALLARRPVAEIANRVDRLPGASGRHQDPHAGERPRARGASAGGGEIPGQPSTTIAPARPAAPLPTSPPARRPVLGVETCTPRRRRTSRFSRTAGCSHISVCMAGQTTTGARWPGGCRQQVVDEMPAAYRPDQAAVAGATTTRSAPGRARVWGIGSSSSHETGLRAGSERESREGGLADEAGRAARSAPG